MNIKDLHVIKNPKVKIRLCTFSLASVMAISMTGCSNQKNNSGSENHESTLVSSEIDEVINTVYLDEKSSEIYKDISLSNEERRGILLSNEPHLYESMFEKTDTKVYLSDENGKRLSKNFDEISLLENYIYLTTGGVLFGNWTNVKTDKQYDYFVGTTLRQDKDGNTVNPTITLLDGRGLEVCSFNGYFEALVGNTIVIKDYFEGEDRIVGSPDTHLYDFVTGKDSEKHDYVKIFKYENELNQDEETFCLIGVNLYYEKSSASKGLYSFYDRNLDVISIVTEDEIEEWYKSNDDWDSFNKAGGNYNDYFKSIYQNTNDKEKQLSLKLTK